MLLGHPVLRRATVFPIGILQQLILNSNQPPRAGPPRSLPGAVRSSLFLMAMSHPMTTWHGNRSLM